MRHSWSVARLRKCLARVDVDRPEDCARALRHLGSLGSLVLGRSVLDAAARADNPPGHLLEDPGSESGATRLLVVWNDDDLVRLAERGILRGAFGLPVAWRRMAGDDPCLPGGIRGEAQRVREQFEEAAWGLVLAEDHGDLSGLDCGGSSAWASLAASLLLAREGHPPSAEILATCAFDHGPKGVRGLREKMELAMELGARHLFVSRENEREAQEILAELPAGRELEVEALPYDLDPAKALRPLVAKLELPPDPEAPLEDRMAYHRRLVAADRRRDATQYYRFLLEDLASACEERSAASAGPLRGRTLITSLSTNPEVAVFAVMALRPACCFVFVTEEARKPDLATVRALLAKGCQEVVESDLEDVSYLGARREAARVLSRPEHADGSFVVDVTPGRKDVALGLWDGVKQVAGLECPAVYVSTERKGRSLVVGTEALIRVGPGEEATRE